MEFNSTSFRSANVGFNAAFQAGMAMATSMYGAVATTVPSSTKTTEYGWLGEFPGFREWIGDRVVNGLAKHGYSLTNKDYENTIGVDRNDFDDDNLGIYTPMFQQLGHTAVVFPDQLIWPQLAAGFVNACYDGQNFFDVDHPVLNAAGKEVAVANTDGGAGTAWFLLDNTRPLKPMIFQERKKFTNLVRMDSETDESVFTKKKLRYGLDGRGNVGYGFWQMAWGSKQTLDAAHYEAARAGLSTMKGDFGRPLAIQPKLLVVPPTLEGAARRLIENDTVNCPSCGAARDTPLGGRKNRKVPFSCGAIFFVDPGQPIGCLLPCPGPSNTAADLLNLEIIQADHFARVAGGAA